MKIFKRQLSMFKCVFLLSILSISLLLSYVSPVLADGKDDPLLTKVLVDQFEKRNTYGSDPLVLDGQAWIGKDLQKLWIKAEVEKVNSETEEAELQALYSHAIAPYWDVQFGLRQDFQPSPSRSWAVFGIQGLAPYFFEVDTALFIGESGRSGLRFEAEYELSLIHI